LVLFVLLLIFFFAIIELYKLEKKIFFKIRVRNFLSKEGGDLMAAKKKAKKAVKKTTKKVAKKPAKKAKKKKK
jgi:hypothetical protein